MNLLALPLAVRLLAGARAPEDFAARRLRREEICSAAEQAVDLVYEDGEIVSWWEEKKE
jgi:hypothetical protein